MAITCGNLPLLAPVFGNMFQRIKTPSGRYAQNLHNSRLAGSSYKLKHRKQEVISLTSTNKRRTDGSRMMYPEEALLDDSSQEQLKEQRSPTLDQQKVTADTRRSNGILVQEEIAVSYLHGPTPNTFRATADVGMHPVPLDSPGDPPLSFMSRAWSEP
jgi:hypothetical protein